jgi:hypothetical protein
MQYKRRISQIYIQGGIWWFNIKTSDGDSISIKNLKDKLNQLINLSEEEGNAELLTLNKETKRLII